MEFEVGGFEDDFNISPAGQGEAENFTIGREKESKPPAAEKSPSEPSLPSKNSSPGLTSREQPEQKPSVKKELQEIKQEQVKKKRKRPNSRIVSILLRAIPVKRRKTERQVMQYRFIKFRSARETGTQPQPEQQYTKEEYASMKQAEREDAWAKSGCSGTGSVQR